jgi:2,4-diketo-3-deoxy-L-fuconate hydrolase
MTSTWFALGTFDAGSGDFPGQVVANAVYDVRDYLPYASTGEILAHWETAFPALAAAANHPTTSALSSHSVIVRPPVQPPGQLFAAGANYRQHIIEMAIVHGLGLPGATPQERAAQAAADIDERRDNGEPYVWTGAPSAISGAYDDVILPSGWDDHDWELELGVVIGKRARNVPAERAMEHVAGYTICNDLTTRSLVPRTDIPMMGTDWLRAKNFPTFFPTGPWLVPAAFVADPLKLGIRLRLNGETMQESNTGDMVFGPAELIAYLSRFVELRPGDMIITGSPPGNGSHHGRYLRPGDVLEGEIDGLGVQRNRCLAEGATA